MGDHLFIHIPHIHLHSYNEQRREAATRIAAHRGPAIHGGWFWFKGSTLPDGSIKEYDEDCTSELRDFTATRDTCTDTNPHIYNLTDVDNISNVLGIPWEPSKDIPFSSTPTFIGFTWDIEQQTVSLAEAKQHKYVAALQAWSEKRAHSLHEVQKLLGKLTHATQIFPEG